MLVRDWLVYFQLQTLFIFFPPENDARKDRSWNGGVFVCGCVDVWMCGCGCVDFLYMCVWICFCRYWKEWVAFEPCRRSWTKSWWSWLQHSIARNASLLECIRACMKLFVHTPMCFSRKNIMYTLFKWRQGVLPDDKKGWRSVRGRRTAAQRQEILKNSMQSSW